MSNDNLKSFKISDQVRTQVDKPRRTTSVEEPASAGFPKIEALVEADARDLQGFEERRALLTEMAKTATGNKEKAAAKKAAAAYDRVRGLIDFLVETKAKMQRGAGEA
jgi:hypothetical protein